MRKFNYPFVLGLLFILTVGCEKKDDVTSIQQDQLELNRKYGNIMRYINLEDVGENISCRSLPIGSKACGGPQGYVAFPESINQEELEEMIEEYTEFERDYNEKWGIISDCSHVSPPIEVIVQNGKCKAVFN